MLLLVQGFLSLGIADVSGLNTAHMKLSRPHHHHQSSSSNLNDLWLQVGQWEKGLEIVKTTSEAAIITHAPAAIVAQLAPEIPAKPPVEAQVRICKTIAADCQSSLVMTHRQPRVCVAISAATGMNQIVHACCRSSWKSPGVCI